MTWTHIRAEYARRLSEVKASGHTQEDIAIAGGLAVGQTAISKMVRNQRRGPSVETFVGAVRGLGIPLSLFFAELEAQLDTPDDAASTLDPAPAGQLFVQRRKTDDVLHAAAPDPTLDRAPAADAPLAPEVIDLLRRLHAVLPSLVRTSTTPDVAARPREPRDDDAAAAPLRKSRRRTRSGSA